MQPRPFMQPALNENTKRIDTGYVCRWGTHLNERWSICITDNYLQRFKC